jgi:ClpP class serine protease
MNSNIDIDHFVLSGPMLIWQDYAIEQLGLYLEDLAYLEKGASFKDLGISDRRHAARPGVIYMSKGRPVIVQDPDLIKDSELTPLNSFAHLRLQGVMRSRGGAFHQGVTSLIDQINQANSNPKIQGILLEVNTGGGEVTAAEMLYSVIDASPKPIVAYAHLMASGGVMAALPADEIIASNAGARIGSIGTMISLPRGFGERYNRWYQDIYADKSQNKNHVFRELINGNLQPLKDELNVTNEGFLAKVQLHRNLKGSETAIDHTLSGAMFTAQEAKKRGLIDGIGGYEYALKRLTAAVKRRANV